MPVLVKVPLMTLVPAALSVKVPLLVIVAPLAPRLLMLPAVVIDVAMAGVVQQRAVQADVPFCVIVPAILDGRRRARAVRGRRC